MPPSRRGAKCDPRRSPVGQVGKVKRFEKLQYGDDMRCLKEIQDFSNPSSLRSMADLATDIGVHERLGEIAAANKGFITSTPSYRLIHYSLDSNPRIACPPQLNTSLLTEFATALLGPI